MQLLNRRGGSVVHGPDLSDSVRMMIHLGCVSRPHVIFGLISKGLELNDLNIVKLQIRAHIILIIQTGPVYYGHQSQIWALTTYGFN